jgi:hypothetical protein
MNKKASRRAFVLSALTLLCAGSAYAAPASQALDMNHRSVRAAIAVQNRATPALMKNAEVLGTAVGEDGAGGACLIVFVDKNHPNARNVSAPGGSKIIFTDPFRAGGPKPDGVSSISYTAKQPIPIKLGTSGGWRGDLANGYCCGGTLGSLISVNGVQYIMSNYHVFEGDIVGGGNKITAATGDPIIQPGLIDVGCNANSAQNVGTLVQLSSLFDGSLNNVDVSVAKVIPDMVDSSGFILGIGTISTETNAPALGQLVKKSGRTSGLTRSKISGLNATVRVSYETECAGTTAFTMTYTGQIVVAKGATFLKGGDSGSTMVEDVAIKPKTIGLLYAGSSTAAIANPIGEVLAFVGSKLGGTATMVGVP